MYVILTPGAWGGVNNPIGTKFPQGKFNRNGIAPNNLPARVELHVGLLSQTLPVFITEQVSQRFNQYISFLHIDCDLYTSTFEALASSVCLFVKGTIIEFDEALGYLGWETSGEWLAFTQIVSLFDLKWTPLTTFKMRMSVSIENEVRSMHPACEYLQKLEWD